MSGNTLHPITAIYQAHTKAALYVALETRDYWFAQVAITCDEPLNSYERGERIAFFAPAWLLIKYDLEHLIDNKSPGQEICTAAGCPEGAPHKDVRHE